MVGYDMSSRDRIGVLAWARVRVRVLFDDEEYGPPWILDLGSHLLVLIYR
jgi:hypothetical protein